MESTDFSFGKLILFVYIHQCIGGFFFKSIRFNHHLFVFLKFFLELKEILTVDGTYKLIYSINGEFPGPAIVVYEGQTVTLLFL